MQPNKTVAVLMALAALAIAPPAAAQDQPQADLKVEAFVPGGTLVVNRSTEVHVVVRNVGDRTFSTQAPWEVHLTHEGACIQSDPVVPDSGPCRQTTQRGAEAPGNTIDPGATHEFVFQWTPSPVHAGSIRVAARIQGVNGVLPPPPQRANENDYAEFPVFVGLPGVRAAPDRDLPRDGSGRVVVGSDINTPWTLEGIKASECDESGAPNRAGCLARPGSLVVFSYKVKNAGNIYDSYRASIVDNTGLLAARGYKFYFSNDPITLEPDGEGYVNLTVEVPANETADSGININSHEMWLRWESTLDSRVTTRDPPCPPEAEDEGICEDPLGPSIAAAKRHAFAARANATRAAVSLANVTTFEVTVRNDGNAPDAFTAQVDFDASAVRPWWIADVNLSQLAHVDPGKEGTAKISLIPPGNATAGPHPMEVVVQSAQAPTGQTQRVRFVADLVQRYNVSLVPATTIAHVVPGKAATYEVAVANHGNGWDNVTLALDNVTAGWSRSLSASRVTLPPFGSAVVVVTATPPPNTRNDTQMEFFLRASSAGGASDSRAFRLAVKAGSNLDATLTPRESFVDLGKTVTYLVRVRNVGNIADEFAVRADREQGGASWKVTAEPSQLVLAPLQESVVTVNVTGPGAGDVGETLRVLLHLTATSDRVVHTYNLTARVSGPDLYVDSLAVDKANPYSGDVVEISLVIGNAGNRAPPSNATLRLEYLKDGVPALVGGEERSYSTTLLGGGARLVERIPWNTTGVQGALVLRATIDPANALKEIDDSPASNQATRALTVRTLELHVTPAHGLSGRPGERLRYSEDPHVFLVEYRGNQPSEPVTIRLESEHGWGSVERDVDLPAYGAVPIPIDVQIPADPGVASDVLRLTVTPRLRPDAAVISTAVTTVLDDAPPQFLEVAAEPEAVGMNEAITLRARVHDATGVAEVRAVVAAPGSGSANDTRHFLLAREGGEWILRQGFSAPGTYRYYLVARDNADPANENSTAAVVRTFRVAPGSEPVVKLADGQPTTIRAGPPIRLNITDPLGVATANYTIKGIRFDMQRPFDQIDTTAFAAGTVEILVTAENVYGAARSSRFTFTVDNTPPVIRKVALTPAEPEVRQETTLRVETDSDAASVSVVVRRDGQVVATLNATRRSAGVWEAAFAPETGDHVLDVTARDAAGNARVQEEAARFRADTGSLIPGPAAWMALAAAGAAALAARRKR